MKASIQERPYGHSVHLASRQAEVRSWLMGDTGSGPVGNAGGAGGNTVHALRGQRPLTPPEQALVSGVDSVREGLLALWRLAPPQLGNTVTQRETGVTGPSSGEVGAAHSPFGWIWRSAAAAQARARARPGESRSPMDEFEMLRTPSSGAESARGSASYRSTGRVSDLEEDLVDRRLLGVHDPLYVGEGLRLPEVLVAKYVLESTLEVGRQMLGGLGDSCWEFDCDTRQTDAVDLYHLWCGGRRSAEARAAVTGKDVLMGWVKDQPATMLWIRSDEWAAFWAGTVEPTLRKMQRLPELWMLR